MKTKILIAVIAIVFVTVNLAQAELKPTLHSGLYLGLGVGGGTASMNFQDGNSIGRDGGFVNFRIGGAFNQKMMMGLEVDTWATEEYGATWSLTNVTLAMIYYPHDKIFVKAGPGFAEASVEYNGVTGSTSGGGFTLGGGAEFRLTDKFALVPTLNVLFQGFEGFDTSMVSLMLGFNWFL